MARVRSPNYPAVSLQEAIQRVKRVHEQEQHLPADKEVIAKHLGYSGLNGASLKMVSALGKYGLIEDVGDKQARVSDLAVLILFPESDEQKKAAVREAATKPALFAEMLEHWDGHLPSDENIRSYLIRRNFAQSAIDKVIQSFRDTMTLITPDLVGNGLPSESTSLKEKASSHPPVVRNTPVATPTSPTTGMRVSITENGLEVSANLKTEAEVANLIRVLEANKLLLQTIDKAFDIGDTDEELGE